MSATLPPGWKLRHIAGRAGTFSKALYDDSRTYRGEYTFDGYGIPLAWRIGVVGYPTQDAALDALLKEHRP